MQIKIMGLVPIQYMAVWMPQLVIIMIRLILMTTLVPILKLVTTVMELQMGSPVQL